MRDLTTIRRDMGDSIPRYYGDFPVITNLLDREAAEMATLNAEVYDVLDQFFIDTATWGLANWERVCGITTDETKPYDQRRSVIKSKLRGIGTVTVAMIQNVAESYNNGTVTVTEDNVNYTVKITFVSSYGIPANLADTQAALREIIPAHLAITFEFMYVTYDQLKTQYASYGAIVTANKTYDAIITNQ